MKRILTGVSGVRSDVEAACRTSVREVVQENTSS
jgi:hypothetical protein